MILKPIPIKIRMQRERAHSINRSRMVFDSWYAKSAAIVYKESRKEEYLNDSVQFMNRSLAQITGENMIGANGRSVPEMALPESYNYIHKSGTLHEAPSPIIPLNWSKASMTLMLKEMSNLINDEELNSFHNELQHNVGY